MEVRFGRSLAFCCALLILFAGLSHRSTEAQGSVHAASLPPVEITLLTEDGGRADWSHALDLIAYDRMGSDGYYDVHLMTPQGVEGPCITCDNPLLPNRNIGNPAWHPYGAYLAIQVEKLAHDGNPASASPGLGINNDIWIIRRDGQQAIQITDVAEGMGVLHPHFSHDGSKLLWAERVADGSNPSGLWLLRLLDLGDPARLDRHAMQLTSYAPMGLAFYESHGFSPDDTQILFTAHDMLYTPNRSWMDIYALELETLRLRRLTYSPAVWDEHAQFSPDGQYITWISSQGCNCYPLDPRDIATELFMMRADGSEKTQLTTLNAALLPGMPNQVAADHAWNAAGSSLVLYVQDASEQRPLEGKLVRVDFPAIGTGLSQEDHGME